MPCLNEFRHLGEPVSCKIYPTRNYPSGPIDKLVKFTGMDKGFAFKKLSLKKLRESDSSEVVEFLVDSGAVDSLILFDRESLFR